MVSHCQFLLVGTLLTLSVAGAYLFLKRDSIEDFIKDKKRELKIGDRLSQLYFPSDYHATGVLRLVTSKIDEPFEAWYSKRHQKSRIDYYQGEVRTFQRGDLGRHGMFFKMIPKYSYKTGHHWRGCWKRYGTTKHKITAQSVLPHDASWPFRSKLEDFKYVKDVRINGKLCTKWTYQINVKDKKNSYEFYATKTVPPLPVRLVMNGYDTLLVSYYDTYVIDYHSFQKWHYNADKFKIPKLHHDKWCWDTRKLKHLGDAAALALNPMSEFTTVGHEDDPVDHAFDHFKQQHQKKYKDYKEHQQRKHIFRHNIRYIRSTNRRNLNYHVKTNHFADLTDNEYNLHKGDLSDDNDDDESNNKKYQNNDNDDNDYLHENGESKNYQEYNNEADNEINYNDNENDYKNSKAKENESRSYENMEYIYNNKKNNNKAHEQHTTNHNDDNDDDNDHDYTEERERDSERRRQHGEHEDYPLSYDENHFEDTNVRRNKISKTQKHHDKPRRRGFQVPDQLDWRKYGAVTPPKGQGTCGSCWAFASVGAVEGANFIKSGKLVNFSEQQLVDCTWFTPGVKKGNNGCLGGWTWKGFAWIKKNGVATAKSYGHYRGQEGYCKTKNITVGARIRSYRRVKRYNPIALKKAISFHGPATISINANPKALKFYSKGVMDDVSCNNKTDHAVLLIGYGHQDDIPYWLIKNSWSHKWGNHGFIKIKQGLCGIEKRPFVVLNDNTGKKLPWEVDKSTKKDEIYYPEKRNNEYDHDHFYWT